MNLLAKLPLLPRLTAARAIAWALLLAGWVGLGSIAMVLARSVLEGFALVALWLLALGISATVATRDQLPATMRQCALLVCSVATALALFYTTRGGGLPALLVALFAWSGLTALASGVVRRLRLSQMFPPNPPIGAASIGAVCAALVLADIGDLQALTLRLALLVIVAALLLVALQIKDTDRSGSKRCRAGLFDCSLPAWPSGAWHDVRQWPTLLAGLAMLPMMATLPLMVSWCRAQSFPPEAMILLHFAAMFAPALLFRRAIGLWSARTVSTLCMLALVAGAILGISLERPLNLIGLALAHGCAWGLAWAGQLWAPDRRSQSGTSPLRAALGYALLTLAFGVVVASLGERGVTATHALLGMLAVLAWLIGRSTHPGSSGATTRMQTR
jgi:hypothetical protein